ncbi:MAG: hypothetical protein KatS3mg038_2772 [Candidatus Kapaibacterium sp.]|nr:MAG: hypothetical protein KatS3mg038_2772 [Candidatus Kapabacteria bacterium]
MTTITASVVPAIMGHDPYNDRLAAWLKLTKRAPQEPQSEAARIGEHLERYAVEWLQTQHGIAIADTQVHTSVDVTDQWRMYARLDAITDDGTPVEIKTTREYDGRVPDTWYLQIQAQLIAARRDHAMLVVVSRADAVTTLEVVEADAATQRSIIDECDKFCTLHLVTDSPPYSSNAWIAAEAASALGYCGRQSRSASPRQHASSSCAASTRGFRSSSTRSRSSSTRSLRQLLPLTAQCD